MGKNKVEEAFSNFLKLPKEQRTEIQQNIGGKIETTMPERLAAIYFMLSEPEKVEFLKRITPPKKNYKQQLKL